MRVDDVRLDLSGQPVNLVAVKPCLALHLLAARMDDDFAERLDVPIPSSTLPAHFLQAVMRGRPWRIR